MIIPVHFGEKIIELERGIKIGIVNNSGEILPIQSSGS
jgi:hypothetical protein